MVEGGDPPPSENETDRRVAARPVTGSGVLMVANLVFDGRMLTPDVGLLSGEMACGAYRDSG
jgi:hypothetical protein